MKRRTTDNKYDGLVEPWKVRLVISRARRLGFRRHELEDVQQEIMLEVISFVFDPAKGASESTPLTALIDNRLKSLRRKARRYANRVTTIGDAIELDQTAREAYQDDLSLRLDVLSAIATLSPDELAVCLGLIEGLSINEIARRLNCGWHTVDRRSKSIRQLFNRLGLKGWLDQRG